MEVCNLFFLNFLFNFFFLNFISNFFFFNLISILIYDFTDNSSVGYTIPIQFWFRLNDFGEDFSFWFFSTDSIMYHVAIDGRIKAESKCSEFFLSLLISCVHSLKINSQIFCVHFSVHVNLSFDSISYSFFNMFMYVCLFVSVHDPLN